MFDSSCFMCRSSGSSDASESHLLAWLSSAHVSPQSSTYPFFLRDLKTTLMADGMEEVILPGSGSNDGGAVRCYRSKNTVSDCKVFLIRAGRPHDRI